MKTEYDSYDLFAETDNHLTRPRFHTDREQRFYPSEASVKYHDEHGDLLTAGGCLRATYFRIAGGYPSTSNEARSEWIFKQGKDVEETLVEVWKEMGIWRENNIKFINKEYNVSGEIDAILSEPPHGNLYGVEVKSFYGYMGEKEIMGNKSQKGFPKMNQLLQTLVYLYFFQDRLKYFRMAYFARDSVKRRTFKIELHKEGDLLYPKVEGVVIRSFTLNGVLQRYKDLQGYIDRKEVPPNDYELMYSDAKIEDYYKKGKVAKTKYELWKKGKLKKHEYIGDWECRYCKFRNVCWGDGASQLEDEESSAE